MKLLVYKNLKFLWQRGSLNTEYGILKESDIKKAKNKVKTHLNHEFQVYDPNFVDKFKKLKRGPAIILPKDIGYILAITGIGKDSIIAEAGSGSAFLTAYLANIAKKVYSYEIKKEFYEIAKYNLSLLDLKNVILKNSDVSKGISAKNIDVIILDLPNPENCLNSCYKSLIRNGFLVCYLPNITQIQSLLKKIKKYSFNIEKITELLERNWEFSNLRSRPKTHMLAHTSFLVILRKI